MLTHATTDGLPGRRSLRWILSSVRVCGVQYADKVYAEVGIEADALAGLGIGSLGDTGDGWWEMSAWDDMSAV